MPAPSPKARPSSHLSLAILRDGLWSGQISEREFNEQCRLAGFSERQAQEVIAELKEHDDV